MFQFLQTEPLGLLLVAAVFCVLYVFAATLITSFYAVFRKFEIGNVIDPRPLKKGQVRTEILWGLCTSCIASVYLWVASVFQPIPIFPESAQSAIMQILMFIVLYDAYMYATHRWFHTTWMSKFHGRHHKAIAATPWSCLNMHPVEAVVNYLPFLILALALPLSLVVLYGIYAYLLFGIAHGHCNYTLVAHSKMQKQLRELVHFHQYHHSSPDRNFGYLYTHWDHVFGTQHTEPVIRNHIG